MTFLNFPLLNHLKLIFKLKFSDNNLTYASSMSFKSEI